MKDEEVESHLSDFANYLRASEGTDKPGTGRVGKYQVGEVIGKGGQSVAVKAWDPDLERDVVLKVYHSVETEEQRERVLAEGRALAKINSPYVARCHNVETFAGNPCLVLERVQGMNLASQVRLGVYSPEDAATVIAKIADGLDAVHKCGLVHRDLKPDNIVIQPDGTPKIIDFGLSTHGRASVQDTSGTAVYMPPERALGDSGGDVRGDVFGLGTILYEMLTGRPPFIAETKEAALENARRGQLSAPLPNPQHGVSKVCLKCVCPSPSNRYETASEVATSARRAIRKPNRKYLWVPIAILLPMLGFAIAKFTSSPSVPNPKTEDDTTIYWVDSQAKPSGDGFTRETAFQSLKAAIDVANSNDIIKIRGYNARIAPLFYKASGLILAAGRHDGITIEPWGDENPDKRPGNELLWRPIIVGAFPVEDEHTDADRQAFNQTRATWRISASNATIRNIAVRGAGGCAFQIEGNSGAAVADITVLNCEVYRSRGPAIICRNAEDVSVADCLIRICAEYQGEAAIEVSDSTGVQLDNNEILNPANEVTAGGISIANCSGVELDMNAIRKLPKYAAVTVSSSNEINIDRSLIHDCGSGICLVGASRSYEVDLFCNIIAACNGPGIRVGKSVPLADFYAYYNTIIDCEGDGFRMASSEVRSSRFMNNLLMNNGQLDILMAQPVDLAIENNAVAGGRVQVPSGFSQLGQNIDIPTHDGRPVPQLLIQKEAMPPHEAESYAPLLDSVLIRRGESRRLQIPVTKCAAARERDPKQCDIGAVEHAR